MRKPNLILFGPGGHAHSCIDVIEQLDSFKIAGLISAGEGLQNECMGYRIIGKDSDLPELAKQYEHALITVGQIETARVRWRIYDRALALGFSFPSIISPRAYVSPHAVVGDGTIVMHGAIVNAGAIVGNNCIINSSALIEHDATVADHCHVATGAIVNGDVSIGMGSFVGSGSVIKQGVTIGGRCVIGMGISVRHDHAESSRIFSGSRL